MICLYHKMLKKQVNAIMCSVKKMVNHAFKILQHLVREISKTYIKRLNVKMITTLRRTFNLMKIGILLKVQKDNEFEEIGAKTKNSTTRSSLKQLLLFLQ